MTINLHEQRQQAIGNAKAILQKAQLEGRELRDHEQTQVKAAMDDVKNLDKQIEGRALATSVMGLTNCDDDPDKPSGSIFSDADAKGIVAAVKTRQSYRAEVPSKAALPSTLVPTAGLGVAPGVYPGTAFPIASLFANEAADGPTVRFYQMSAATAAITAEGAAKPDSGLAVTAVDVALKKIATLVKFTDEFADDAPFLLRHLQQELTSAVIVAENASILASIGAASGIQTGTGTTATALDVIADAIAAAEALNGITPTAVVVNPSVLGTLRKAKASTAGSYYLDPLLAGPSTVHGVQLVSSAATATGTGWVLTSPGVVVYRRGGISADIGWDGTDFASNLRTLRVEERFATAVLRPGMISKLTLT